MESNLVRRRRWGQRLLLCVCVCLKSVVVKDYRSWTNQMKYILEAEDTGLVFYQ